MSGLLPNGGAYVVPAVKTRRDHAIEVTSAQRNPVALLTDVDQLLPGERGEECEPGSETANARKMVIGSRIRTVKYVVWSFARVADAMGDIGVSMPFGYPESSCEQERVGSDTN
jgi:hypothetical protein